MTAHLSITGPAIGGPHRFWTQEGSDEHVGHEFGDGTRIELWEEEPTLPAPPEPAQRTYEVTFALPGGATSTTTVKAATFGLDSEYAVATFHERTVADPPPRRCVAMFVGVISIIDVTDEQDVPAEGDGATEPEPDIPCHSSVDLNPGDLGA